MIRRVEIERSTYASPPHRFEAGTPPIGAAIGMGAAAAWLATLDWARIGAHEIELTERLLAGLTPSRGSGCLDPSARSVAWA